MIIFNIHWYYWIMSSWANTMIIPVWKYSLTGYQGDTAIQFTFLFLLCQTAGGLSLGADNPNIASMHGLALRAMSLRDGLGCRRGDACFMSVAFSWKRVALKHEITQPIRGRVGVAITRLDARHETWDEHKTLDGQTWDNLSYCLMSPVSARLMSCHVYQKAQRRIFDGFWELRLTTNYY